MKLVTSALIKALDYADSPRSVKVISGMLEKQTGMSIDGLENWHVRNGFYRLGAMQGGTSYAGKTITLENALDVSAFYAGVKMISEDMGTMPFHVYTRSKDRKKTERAYDSVYYQTLHDLVNPEVAAGEFVEALTAHSILCGGGFAEIQRFPSGVYLWPWLSGSTRADRDGSGKLVYIHCGLDGKEKTYARSDVFHLRGFTLDCLNGDSILHRARHILGLSLAVNEFTGRYFTHGTALDVVLERPVGSPVLNETGVQNLKKLWKEWHQGSANSHEIGVLQEGTQAKIMTPNAEQSQLMAVRTFQVLEACRALRMQPHKLAEMSHATFSNIDAENVQYLNLTLSPHRRRWREAFYRTLLTFDEQRAGQLYAEQDIAGFLSGNFEAQSEGFRKMLEKGVYSINDVRRMLNMNPIDGGDCNFVQLNLGTVQEIAAGLNLPNAIVPVKPKEPAQPVQ